MSEEEEAPSVEKLREEIAPVLKAAKRSTFFHTVALLERLTNDAARVGSDGPPSAEQIRFRHDHSLSFSKGDISQVRVRERAQSAEDAWQKKTPIVEVTTTFLGLTGSVSPLPLYLTEEVVHEDPSHPIRRDFLDIFHHRLISFFYRAVSKYSPAREHTSSESDAWMRRALCLTGLDPEIQTNDGVIPPSILVRLAPLLAGRGRGGRVLALALREALGEGLSEQAKIEVRQFAGGWIEIDDEQQSRLGTRNCRLGQETILGKKAYDQSGRFAIRIGPLDAANYARFARGGDLYKRLRKVVTLAVRECLDYDIELELAPEAVKPFRLGLRDGARLAKDARLRGRGQKGEVLKISDAGREPA